MTIADEIKFMVLVVVLVIAFGYAIFLSRKVHP